MRFYNVGIKRFLVAFAFLSAFALAFQPFVLKANAQEIEVEQGLVIENEIPGSEFALDSSENLVEISGKRQLIAVYPQSVVGPVDPGDTSGFKAILLSLFGPYDPIICEYSYTNTQGYVSYIREVQPDYIWLVSAAIFSIVLYCFFRLLGGIIKNG